jgi:hypothetical protein
MTFKQAWRTAKEICRTISRWNDELSAWFGIDVTVN